MAYHLCYTFKMFASVLLSQRRCTSVITLGMSSKLVHHRKVEIISQKKKQKKNKSEAFRSIQEPLLNHCDSENSNKGIRESEVNIKSGDR